MKLKKVVDSLDGIPEATQALYAKGDDGKFHLDVDVDIPDLSADVARLQKALQKERDAREAAEKAAKSFDGINKSPDELRELVKRLENDEEMQLISKGDTTKLRERWTERMRAEYEKKLKAAEDAANAASQKAKVWETRVLDNEIRQAATRSNLPGAAVEDVLLRARAAGFVLDENGRAVQMRDGIVVTGKDGKTPFNAEEWVESLRETAPHLFPATGSGSGAPQSPKPIANGSAANVLKRAAFDQLTPAEKMAHVKQGGQVTD